MDTAAFVTLWLRPALRATRFFPLSRNPLQLGVRLGRQLHPRCTIASAAGPKLNEQVFTDNGMFATDSSFNALGVSEEIVNSLSEQGFVTPTKAQAAVVPVVLDGLDTQVKYANEVRLADERDSQATASDVAEQAAKRPRPPENDAYDVMMVGAETGSGKTLAYLLPFVETVRQNAETKLKAVILVPSRELCQQVAKFLTSYFKDAPAHIVLAGGLPPDVADIKNVRVVIATPTALLNYFRFSQKPDTSDKYIVVDEADMLLSGSFLKDIEQILDQPGMKPFATRRNGELRKVNRNRLLFVGATYPHWTGEKVRSIVTWMRRRYPDIKSIQTEDIHKRSVRLQSRWQYTKTMEDRMEALMTIIEEEMTETDKVMIFASKADTMQTVAREVRERLGEEKIAEKFGAVLELHKNVAAKERVANLEEFRRGDGRILFCTDLGARGLDLGNVTRIIEFEFSSNVVGYLHRIGRTARAGAAGATDHFFDDVSKPLADAIRQRSDMETTVVEGVFSRKRSFRRKLKKKKNERVADDLSTVAIDAVDEEEQKRFDG